MTSPKSLLIFSLLLSFSTNALAVCEHERGEYKDWNSKCEKLSAASQVSGTAGGLFAIVTFGVSMIPCAAAIAAANNACRIRDEKRQNLANCEAHHARLAQEAQAAIDRARAAEQARLARVKQINTDFSSRRTAIVQQYDQMVRDFVANYAAEGWSIDDPDSQEHIRTTRARMEQERDQKLDQLEAERKEAVTNA